MTQIHNQQNNNDRLYAWKRNMPHPLKTRGAIHLGRFILGRVNRRNGRQINDRVPADVLPYFRCSENSPEILSNSQPQNRLIDELHAEKQYIDYAFWSQRRLHNVGSYYP
ncbi:hypothetical protein D3C78_1330060 [compost metagenome]